MDEDVKDILEIEREPPSISTPQLSKEAIMGTLKDSKKKRSEVVMKRPSGMNREVYALLYSDNKDRNASSLIPTDTGCGYRQPKARLGRKHVRPWKWMSFTNPARSDGLVLSHWRRAADEGKEYPYAQFSKSVDVPSYTDEEYTKHLSEETWTKEETDHLFQLCRQFELRFTIIQDRFDARHFQKRSIEDLKGRYYSVCNRLTKAHNPTCENSQLIAYDAPHECKRKLQLERLLNRTQEQVVEEELLVAELKKIEMRKKERERKQQDLQKLISAAEQNAERARHSALPPSTTHPNGVEKNRSLASVPRKRPASPCRKGTVKKTVSSSKKKTVVTPGQTKSEGSVVFKSYDKSSGVSLRSSKMKTPMTLGQKKAKAIEQLLEELSVGSRPMPTEQICVQFNELRNDILLLLDLKAACDACEFELQSLRHRCESLPVQKQHRINLPELAPATPKRPLASGLQIIDVVTSATTGRKRRLATLDTSIKKARKS